MILPVACGILRVVAVIVAIVIIVRCLMSLFREKPGKEIWGWLTLGDGTRLDLCHWENAIGRGAMGGCQSGFSHRLPQPCGPAGRQGSWKLQPLQTKNGTRLNGKKVTHTVPVKTGDVVDWAASACRSTPSAKGGAEQAMRWGVAERPLSPGRTLGIPDRFPNHDGSAVPARPGERDAGDRGGLWHSHGGQGTYLLTHAEANGPLRRETILAFFCVPFLP